MKLTNVKAMIAKVFTIGLLAGAVVMAAPTKAEAQVGIGVRIGPAVPYGYRRPVYVAPAPYYGYYGRPYYVRPYWEHREFFRDGRRFYR